jgi:hypothetical protein
MTALQPRDIDLHGHESETVFDERVQDGVLLLSHMVDLLIPDGLFHRVSPA